MPGGDASLERRDRTCVGAREAPGGDEHDGKGAYSRGLGCRVEGTSQQLEGKRGKGVCLQCPISE